MVREGEIKNSYFHRSKGRATIFLNFVPRRLRTFNFPSRLPFSWRISLMHFYDLFVEKIPSPWLFVCRIFLCLVRGSYTRRRRIFLQISKKIRIQTNFATSKKIKIWTESLPTIKEHRQSPNRSFNIAGNRQNLNEPSSTYRRTSSESKQMLQHWKTSSRSKAILHLWKYIVRIQTNLPTSKKLIGIYINRYSTSDANNCTAYVHAFIGNVKAYSMYIIFKNT